MSRSGGLRAQSAFHPPYFQAIFRWLTSFRFRTMTQFLSTIPEPFHINWHLNFGAVSVGHEDAVSCLRFSSHLPLADVIFRCRAFRTMAHDDFRAVLHQRAPQFRRPPPVPHEDARSRYRRAPVTIRSQGLRTMRIRGGEPRTSRRRNVSKKEKNGIDIKKYGGAD